MQDAQPNDRTDLTQVRSFDRGCLLQRSPLHRVVARALAACAFGAMVLVTGSLAAQQVLMAPEVRLSFESLEVAGQPEAIDIDYQLAANDWNWASHLGMDVWLGVYASEAAGEWQLQRAQRLVAPQGEVSFENAVRTDIEEFGLCLVVANVDGGQLAPGMGYVCEAPLVVPADGESLDFQDREAKVALRFEKNLEQQPWFSVQRGFHQAASDTGTVQAEGDFFSYRAPSQPESGPPDDARGATSQRFQQGYDRRGYEQRHRPQYGFHGYANQRPIIYGTGFFPGYVVDRNRFTTDRFRRRQLQRRRMFGPMDGFDAKFDQDMFQSHPEDVFYNTPIPPGHFGRDAFGRDLQHGFGVPPRGLRGLQPSGVGVSFD